MPFLTALLAWLGGFVVFTGDLPPPGLGAQAAPGEAQGIVVFTGGSNRISAGVDLLAAGAAPRLLISGVPRGARLGQLGLTAGQIRRHGDRITLGHEARDTYGNAAETAAWARDQGLERVILVTSDYHMRRSLLELRRAAPDLLILPHPVRARTMQHSGWWLNPGVFWIVFSEYNKVILVRLRLLLGL